MAPPKPSLDHTIDRTPEYQEFIATLRAFHEARGTHFDPEPRLGSANVDLLKLYKHIVANGGYDHVSEEKLLWRKMCEDLNLMTSNAPSSAFSLKSIFYKQLSAYWIRTEYNKTPPPPEILEHTTAKGYGILNRTIETFKRKEGAPEHSEASGDDATPSRDRRGAAADDMPSSARASRGLREAPAPRVIFQPDTNSSRQSRLPSAQHPNSSTPTSHPQSQPQHLSHQHSHSQSHLQPVHPPQHQTARGPSYSYDPPNMENFSSVVQNYVPRQPAPIPLRVVDTPANNPEAFANRQRTETQQAQAQATPGPSYLPVREALPAAANPFDGPNIYVRCFQALRSGIKEEQAFGLSHLVKISYERGDKYRFEQFHGLAEGLVEKALEIGRLYWEVDFTIRYDDADDLAIGELDGLNGTSDILDRISRLVPKMTMDSIQPAEFVDDLTLISEAVLTIRNMVMLPENASYLAEYQLPAKDLLCIILNLPERETLVELKHYALDIAEQITPFLALESDDPLYLTLVGKLTAAVDRGIILTSLRAIGRISMNLPDSNKLGNVPPIVLENINNWLLLNDDELMDACLDFLYQYTAVVANVENLLRSIDVEHLVTHLVRLLSHGAKRVYKEIIIETEKKQGSSEDVVPIPRDLLERLIAFEEPERSFTWLRCLFEEDADSSITQITIWQAYNAAFAAVLMSQGRPMINAADFIRNISQVYTNAGAQILREPGSEVQKFIIKGIRPRARPVNPDGREYMICPWTVRTGPKAGAVRKCGLWFLEPEMVFYHILEAHLGETRGADKAFKNSEKEVQCRWAGCTMYPKPTKMMLQKMMNHVKTHIGACTPRPPTLNNNGGGSESAVTPGGSAGGRNSRHNSKRAYVVPAKSFTIAYEETATLPRDERNPSVVQAAGIPMSASLVLRNIARNVVKTESEEELLKENETGGGEPGGWRERLFRNMRPRLFEIMAENKALASPVTSIILILNERRN